MEQPMSPTNPLIGLQNNKLDFTIGTIKVGQSLECDIPAESQPEWLD